MQGYTVHCTQVPVVHGCAAGPGRPADADAPVCGAAGGGGAQHPAAPGGSQRTPGFAALRFAYRCPYWQMCPTQGLTLCIPCDSVHRVRLARPLAQVAIARQLALEWQAYVVRAHALRKVFVSVKGFYFQVPTSSRVLMFKQADLPCVPGYDAPCSRRSLRVLWRRRLRLWGRRSHGWCRTSCRRWAVPTLQFCMMIDVHLPENQMNV